MPPSLSIPSFAQAQLQLLEREHEAEKLSSSALFATTTTAGVSSLSPSTRRTLQAMGNALNGIILQSCRTGIGGRVIGEFTVDAALRARGGTEGSSSDAGPHFGAHGIRVGDVVCVMVIVARSGKDRDGRKEAGKATEGVVTKVSERSLNVAFGQSEHAGGISKSDDERVEELWGQKLWLLKIANDVTHRRMKQTMEKMEKFSESEHTRFMKVLFGHESPSPPDYNSLGEVDFLDPTLNDSQKEAIRFALGSKEIALIHGPPGTGKTHTLIELVLQLVRRNKRILVCGPSNVSVDNIVERLAPHRIPIVRIGHPARLLHSVIDHSLEVLTRTSDAAAIVQDVRKEIDEKQASIRKTRNGRERRAIYTDLKELRKEFRERESKCVDHLVRGSLVVLATLHGAGGHQLKNQIFDVVIIDEASQALEAQCWVPLLTTSQAVLAGDHLQLPPTIKSLNLSSVAGELKGRSSRGMGEGQKRSQALDTNSSGTITMSLETTLFDRLLALHGPSIKRMLTTQYRMHEQIMTFPSTELYESKLIAAESVKTRLLKDLPYEVADTDDTRAPLVFWDTQGGDFPELRDTVDMMGPGGLLGESKRNDMEAAVVVRHVQQLVAAGVRAQDIAVVTPYNGQLEILSQALADQYPGIELGSVDGFQGREKEAVVVSLVRSNSTHEVGFLKEARRLNVAMTRPKRHLCICGDSDTIRRGSHFLTHWMDFLEEHADLRYPDPGMVT